LHLEYRYRSLHLVWHFGQRVCEGLPLEVQDPEIGRKWIVHPFRFRVLKPDKINIDWEHTEAKWIAPEDIGQFETVPNLREAWQRVAP